MGDFLTAVSILLVFIIMFFEQLTAQFEELPCMPDSEKKEECKKIKRKIRHLACKESILLLISLFLFYLMLPDFVSNIRSSKIDFWSFDKVKTIFCSIEVLLFGFSGVIIIKLIQTLKKL